MSHRLSGCAILTMVAAAIILLGRASVPAQTPDLVLTGGKVFTRTWQGRGRRPLRSAASECGGKTQKLRAKRRGI